MTEKLPVLLRASEVAEALDISVPFAYRLMARGDIRTLRIGGTIRVRLIDLHQFIQDNLSEPKETADDQA